MTTKLMAVNNLKTCPYDKSHRVKESRYQIHVSKCKMNHLSNQKEPCPFNAQHLCEKGELEHHLLQCPDRGVLDRQLVASAEGNSYKGHTGVPSYHSPPVNIEESWDSDMTSYPMPHYQPSVEPPNGGIRTDFAFTKPSERRQYYQNLHHKAPADDWDEPLEKDAEDLPNLRVPKSKSYVQVLDQEKPVLELKNIGLGRGQPTASSRIAANIYGQQVPMRQPRSAPNIPGFQPANLGMGRGGSNVTDDGSKQVGCVDKLDFNKIGFGRGAKKD